MDCLIRVHQEISLMDLLQFRIFRIWFVFSKRPASLFFYWFWAQYFGRVRHPHCWREYLKNKYFITYVIYGNMYFVYYLQCRTWFLIFIWIKNIIKPQPKQSFWNSWQPRVYSYGLVGWQVSLLVRHFWLLFYIIYSQ